MRRNVVLGWKVSSWKSLERVTSYDRFDPLESSSRRLGTKGMKTKSGNDPHSKKKRMRTRRMTKEEEDVLIESL